jgi:hypothetical protein
LKAAASRGARPAASNQFQALEEPVLFAGEHKGTHTARFGEIEQRGVALTPKGRNCTIASPRPVPAKIT